MLFTQEFMQSELITFKLLMHSKYSFVQYSVKVKLIFSKALAIEDAPAFFYVLFSMTRGRGVLVMT